MRRGQPLGLLLPPELYESIYRFAFSLVRADVDARDLIQQAFYAWAAKAYQLRDVSKAETWLFTTLHRMFLAGRRRQRKFAHDDLLAASEQLPAVSPEAGRETDPNEVLLGAHGSTRFIRLGEKVLFAARSVSPVFRSRVDLNALRRRKF